MRRIGMFNSVSLDGYFVDGRGDISWAHRGDDAEFRAFTNENASGGGMLLFGRVTYEMMASFWPTPAAAEQMPVVAKQMNEMPKLVASRTLGKPTWANSTVMKGDLVAAIRKLKAEPGPDITIMGSGTVVAQLAAAGLIDEYAFVFQPVVLGNGRTLFEGVDNRPALKRTRHRAFGNGAVFMAYEPAR